jgi:hypothetical protein
MILTQNLPRVERMSIGLTEVPDGIETVQEVTFLPQTCKNIQPFGSPVNIFYRYFAQTMNIFNPKNRKLEVKLIYYKKHFGRTGNHRFVFKLKNNFAPRYEYVGIISTIPQLEKEQGTMNHVILRYINTTRINDIKFLLGLDELENFEDNDLECKNMKETWLARIVKNPYFSTDCKPTEVQGCIRSADVTELFKLNFVFLQSVLKDFGFEVRLGELGYNKTILQSYRKAFENFPFILKSLDVLRSNITPQNTVDHNRLIITADKRKKFECPRILDLLEKCSQNAAGQLNCLTEEDARKLINYMIVHYMLDTKQVLEPDVIQGRASLLKFFINS